MNRDYSLKILNSVYEDIKNMTEEDIKNFNNTVREYGEEQKMTDREIKEHLMFNPETGISKDGTMHDCVYRPRINQPKKGEKMTREEIKNCPFCGNPYANKPKVMSYYNSYTGRQYFIECTNCFATSRHTNSEEGAILAWNRRVDND